MAAIPLRRQGKASTASDNAMALVAVGRSTQKQHFVSRMHMIGGSLNSLIVPYSCSTWAGNPLISEIIVQKRGGYDSDSPPVHSPAGSNSVIETQGHMKYVTHREKNSVGEASSAIKRTLALVFV